MRVNRVLEHGSRHLLIGCRRAANVKVTRRLAFDAGSDVTMTTTTTREAR